MKTYEVERPKGDEGYFVLILKYTTIFFVLWLAAWMILSYVLIRIPQSVLKDFVINNGGLVSVLIAGAVAAYLVKRTLDKYRYGSLFGISFDEKNQQLVLQVVNTMNDKVTGKHIPYASLAIKESIAKNELHGIQRILRIYNGEQLVSELNIELTAWCRHEKIEEIYSELVKWKR